VPGRPARGRLRDVVVWVLAPEAATTKMLAVALFLPGLAIGSGIQEAIAR